MSRVDPGLVSLPDVPSWSPPPTTKGRTASAGCTTCRPVCLSEQTDPGRQSPLHAGFLPALPFIGGKQGAMRLRYLRAGLTFGAGPGYNSVTEY